MQKAGVFAVARQMLSFGSIGVIGLPVDVTANRHKMRNVRLLR
jgi:hypothetical protein